MEPNICLISSVAIVIISFIMTSVTQFLIVKYKPSPPPTKNSNSNLKKGKNELGSDRYADIFFTCIILS